MFSCYLENWSFFYCDNKKLPFPYINSWQKVNLVKYGFLSFCRQFIIKCLASSVSNMRIKTMMHLIKMTCAVCFQLRASYGNVYSLFIGSKPAVVINGFEAMKEAIVVKATDFAGRPQDLFINDVTQRKGVVMVDYGPMWREHRRFTLKTLRNFGLGKKSMEDRILEEIQHTVKTLEKNSGQTLSPQVMFHNAASNIICQVLFGKRYKYDDQTIKLIVRCFAEMTKIANGPWAMLYDSIPLIRHLPLPFNKAFENMEIFLSHARCLVNEHKKTRVSGEPRDFVDCYLDELENKNDESMFSEEQLRRISFDLYVAATDTTSNTLLTAFLYLMNYPHIQEQCQQEIDQVLEGKDRVTFEDRLSMPYMQAVIHEIQRLANTVPLSAFHCTTKDTDLMGYSIPKGTMIIQNLNSVLREEGQWTFPHEFNPENFLNEQGEFVKPEAFMPFSAGPRMCLGEGLARMELFLITVTLLRKFSFIWPEEAGKPDFTPVFGVTLTPKPYTMKVKLRSNH
uniref:Cytochrome P450 2F2-like n=1 Tax=Poecilia latipinna TaxID=48699 RepID=A0A3B3TQF7_9TELE